MKADSQKNGCNQGTFRPLPQTRLIEYMLDEQEERLVMIAIAIYIKTCTVDTINMLTESLNNLSKKMVCSKMVSKV